MTFTNNQARAYQSGSLFLGLDENNREIGISTDRHAITVAGSRSGKGAALIIPNLLRWSDNVLVIDPKGENAERTYAKRLEMGQAVHVVDPFKSADVPDHIRAAFNPLDEISADGFTSREDVEVIADGMVKRSDPKHAEWDDGARDVLAGIIAYVVTEAPPEHRTLIGVRQMLLQPNEALYADAQAMMTCDGCGGLAKAAGVTIITAIESDKGMEKDFLSAARRHSKWIDSPAVASVLATSSFTLSQLKHGSASVFVVLPPQYLETHAAFMRLFVRCAINAMAAGGSGKGKRCLFMLDEFYSLGKIDEIAKAAGLMPSYGVHLWLFLQDIGQLRQLYGREGAETFFGNSDAHIFFGNSDGETLDYVSKRIGNFTPNEVAESPPIKTIYNSRKHSKFGETEQQTREKMATADENDLRKYQHKMGLSGTPRFPPDQIKELVAKLDGAPVAQSMIVFGKGGNVFNLKLSPYFLPPINATAPNRVYTRSEAAAWQVAAWAMGVFGSAIGTYLLVKMGVVDVRFASFIFVVGAYLMRTYIIKGK